MGRTVIPLRAPRALAAGMPPMAWRSADRAYKGLEDAARWIEHAQAAYASGDARGALQVFSEIDRAMMLAASSLRGVLERS